MGCMSFSRFSADATAEAGALGWYRRCVPACQQQSSLSAYGQGGWVRGAARPLGCARRPPRP